MSRHQTNYSTTRPDQEYEYNAPKEIKGKEWERRKKKLRQQKQSRRRNRTWKD